MLSFFKQDELLYHQGYRYRHLVGYEQAILMICFFELRKSGFFCSPERDQHRIRCGIRGDCLFIIIIGIIFRIILNEGEVWMACGKGILESVFLGDVALWSGEQFVIYLFGLSII